MKINRPQGKRARIEMVPLVDMFFLVLVFFIYAMLSMAVHRALPVQLPVSSAAELNQKTILSVTVKDDGSLFLDQTPISLERLPGALIRWKKQNEKTAVQLFADRRVSYQRLFQVLDRIKAAGIPRIALQAEKESAP
jgi:biopolymer transport protein ExbD